MLQVRNPRVTKSWSGGTSSPCWDLCAARARGRSSIPTPPPCYSPGKWHIELFQGVLQRKGRDSPTQLLTSAAPPAMLRASSSCSVEAAGRHWPHPAPLCCPRVTSCPSALHQTPSPCSAGASCTSQHSPDPQPATHLSQLDWIHSGICCFGPDLKHAKEAKKFSSYIPEWDLAQNLHYIGILACV